MRELTMKEEQQKQYEVLQYFTNICNKEKIQFYLAYGTLLGAVREKGFIEWDDDIDIWLLRKEYERLLRIMPKYADDRFFFQTFDTDPHCLATGLGRICVNNTLKWKTNSESAKFHKGIYFDIFPLDNGYDDWRDRYYIFWFKTYQALLRRKVLNYSKYTGKSVVKKIMNWILYHTMSEESIRTKIKKINKRYSLNQHSGVLIAFASAFAGKNRTVLDSTCFLGSIDMQFEELMLPCPSGYRQLLAYMYGDDYMTPTKTKPKYTPAKVLSE